jgi:Zn-dependent peptidase ImmA (M78 family)
MRWRPLAAQAARQAALVRSNLNVGPADAICPFELAQRLGLSTRLVQLPSLEGIYSPEPVPAILVGAERPPGRQRFTCGHEIGHHIFGHGACVAETGGQSSQAEEEYLANQFSACLLMPKVAVDAAFSRRAISVGQVTAPEILEVSQDLGVGFSTLVNHLELTFRLISSDAASTLRRASLPAVRQRVAGFPVEHELFVVNSAWGLRALDMQVGDIALTPPGSTYEGAGALLERTPAIHLIARSPGEGRLIIPGRDVPIIVRICRRSFAGLVRYRFLEDGPDE